MRVLVVTVVHHPEDARISRRQIPALLAAGHDVALAAAWSATGSTPQAGVRAIDLPRASGRDRGRALLAARRVLRRHGPTADIVLLHDPELVPLVAGLRLPAVVWDVHEDTAAALGDKAWLPRPVRGAAAAAVGALERSAARHVHLILAEEGYRARFAGAHPVVPNVPADVPETVPQPGDDRVVYLGRISRGRGAEELLSLADRLPVEVTLELVGPADADVRPAVAAAHERGALRWHGFVPNDAALPLLDGALAGLSPLRDEPNYRHSMPTKVLEYLARGIPVITTPTPPARRIVEAAGAGIVVPYRDVDAMAEAVVQLRADPARRLALADAGRTTVRRDHDWAVHGPAFVAHLERWAR
jgi:glycosyltransferase involved in cell wall biosynthesis